jgi:hypothetical protein
MKRRRDPACLRLVTAKPGRIVRADVSGRSLYLTHLSPGLGVRRLSSVWGIVIIPPFLLLSSFFFFFFFLAELGIQIGLEHARSTSIILLSYNT